MRRPVLRSCCWAGRWLRPRAVSRAAAARPVDLAYNLINGRNSETPLVFLHGLLGSKSNFHSISKALFQRTGRTVVTVDSRNHGDSGHSPVMTYEAMSLDLQNMLNKLELPECILLGHSMGGKIAMTTALQNDARTRQFILTNLVECNGQYIWRVNLEAIANSLDYLLGFPDFNTPFTAPTIFLGGVNSSYISSKEYPEIKRLFPNSIIQHVPEAGHWVHSEKPYDFINAICAFLGTS
ncbi:sn-1-specific diacylglycerol lipase ABHD11 isoform X3 [Mobula birostris]|uniref:sn-1-specific diacylglycerol lipase ABHD11 isoform X3 n=1 Tax=Mobula birostris TaxID=1983395 RepID=UPI003B2855B8